MLNDHKVIFELVGLDVGIVGVRIHIHNNFVEVLLVNLDVARIFGVCTG